MEFKTHKINKEEICIFLNLCNNYFVPKLSEITIIEQYSEKLANHAEHFSLFIDNKMVALSCCYCNDINKDFAFISVTCIHPDFLGQGFGIKLTLYLEEIIRNSGFKRIRFEVNKKNIASQKMHEKIGYSIVETQNDSYYMEKIF